MTGIASTRREFLAGLAAGAVAATEGPSARGDDTAAPLRPVRFGVSTHSFWQFRERRVDVADCIDAAARMGFDGVEILQVRLADESNARLQSVEVRAHALGLAPCGLSTHLGWVSLESAGKDDPAAAVPRSLDLLRKAFA